MTEHLEHHLLEQLQLRQVTFWHRVRAQAVLGQVPVDEPAVVADIGAGAGTLGWILRDVRPRARYTFFEPIEALRNELADEFGADAALASSDDVSRADVVTLLDVVEHIEDDRGFLAPLAEAMRPGSRLVITVPALSLLWSRWDEALGHHRRYTRRQLRAVVDGMPLQVTEVSWMFPELLPPALVRRVTSRRTRDTPDAPDGSDTDDAADFPVFPPRIDRLLFGVSNASFRARRYAPAGTSVLLVATRV